jgi:uncharacterized coiled-coil protein SlyX
MDATADAASTAARTPAAVAPPRTVRSGVMEDRIREVEERSAWLEHRLAEAEEMLRTAFGRIEQLEAEVKRIAERPAAASLFASLHETAWHHIASYAAPPDVYNLCLSSVHFFHEVAISSSAPDAGKKQCGRLKRKLAAATSSSSNEKKNLFATNLLRTSLLSSLGHVLEQINCGITLEAVLKMGALPEGTALIAGSSMVAACLGKYDWKADVDVYCSAEGAPLVRSVRKYLYTILNITHTL